MSLLSRGEFSSRNVRRVKRGSSRIANELRASETHRVGRRPRVRLKTAAKSLHRWLVLTRWLVLCLAVAAAGCGQGDRPQPGLVVLVVVDQFRADLVDRYEALFRHGFRRLLDEGYRFTNASHDHAITSSSQGHATVGTGRLPSHHGIVDNSWLETANNGWSFATGPVDTTVEVVGQPELPGISPRNRLTDGLADWILGADVGARAVTIAQGPASGTGLAPKDRRGHVYWSSQTAGGFVTSTYFRDSYPEWVRRFNTEIPSRIAADTVWESSVLSEGESLSRRDSAAYEGDHIHVTFPHRFREEASDPDDPSAHFAWIRSTPMHDRLILSLVREAITTEQLGRRGVTDYLGINLSSLDDVGHEYGPLSREQLDALLRLDREIGDFLFFLDAELGSDGYVLALTGDHGAAVAPEYAVEIDAPGRRVTQESMDDLFDAVRAVAQPPDAYDPTLASRVAEVAESFDFVADAMTRDEMEAETPADSFVARYRNSYRPDRVPWFPLRSSDRLTLAHYGVMVRLTEGTIPDYATSVHGSPYDYDRRVPLFFLGTGVGHDISSQSVHTVDIAPTLAAMAVASIPNDIDGEVLSVGTGEDR